MRDVWMIQRDTRVRLTLEAGDAFTVVCERLGQHLQRDVASQLRVARPIDLPHAAGPKG